MKMSHSGMSFDFEDRFYLFLLLPWGWGIQPILHKGSAVRAGCNKEVEIQAAFAKCTARA